MSFSEIALEMLRLVAVFAGWLKSELGPINGKESLLNFETGLLFRLIVWKYILYLNQCVRKLCNCRGTEITSGTEEAVM